MYLHMQNIRWLLGTAKHCSAALPCAALQHACGFLCSCAVCCLCSTPAKGVLVELAVHTFFGKHRPTVQLQDQNYHSHVLVML
jgi:hypothetical protein